MLSTTQMIQRLEGMVGSKDLTEWEDGFVRSLVEKVAAGQVIKLSEKQVENLERLHNQHFG